MTFGEKVKDLRNRKGLTQPALGKLIGVSSRTIASYEAGRSYPKAREVYDRLAKELDTDVNYLRTENEEFLTDVGAQYGQRGQMQAEEILEQSKGLFAGGSLSPEDEIAFIQEIQQMYLDSKKKAKRFTPKKYLKDKTPSDQ